VFLHWDGESWTDADPPHARWRGALTSLDLTSRGVLWALGYRVKEVKVELGSETRAWTVLNRLGTAGWRPVAGLQGWILEEIDDAGDGVAYAVGRQAGRSDLVAVRCPADAPSPRSGR
jgi:hypothetical protein